MESNTMSPSMGKYEYKTVCVSYDELGLENQNDLARHVTNTLNKYSSKGWELASTDFNADNWDYYLTFRRER